MDTSYYYVLCKDKREVALLRDWYIEWLSTVTRFVGANKVRNEVTSPGIYVRFVTQEQADRNQVLTGIKEEYILSGFEFGQGLARRTNIEEIADRWTKDTYEQCLKEKINGRNESI